MLAGDECLIMAILHLSKPNIVATRTSEACGPLVLAHAEGL